MLVTLLSLKLSITSLRYFIRLECPSSIFLTSMITILNKTFKVVKTTIVMSNSLFTHLYCYFEPKSS